MNIIKEEYTWCRSTWSLDV